jgi:hypothetical protein
MNPKIIAFLENPPDTTTNRRQWLKEGHLSIYIKAGHAYTGTALLSVINLSNFEVKSTDPKNPEKNMGKGIFTKFLDELEQLAPIWGYEAIKVESIINPRLTQYLMRRGFTPMADGTFMDFAPNLIKIFPKKKGC